MPIDFTFMELFWILSAPNTKKKSDARWLSTKIYSTAALLRLNLSNGIDEKIWHAENEQGVLRTISNGNLISNSQ